MGPKVAAVEDREGLHLAAQRGDVHDHRRGLSGRRGRGPDRAAGTRRASLTQRPLAQRHELGLRKRGVPTRHNLLTGLCVCRKLLGEPLLREYVGLRHVAGLQRRLDAGKLQRQRLFLEPQLLFDDAEALADGLVAPSLRDGLAVDGARQQAHFVGERQHHVAQLAVRVLHRRGSGRRPGHRVFGLLHRVGEVQVHPAESGRSRADDGQRGADRREQRQEAAEVRLEDLQPLLHEDGHRGLPRGQPCDHVGHLHGDGGQALR